MFYFWAVFEPKHEMNTCPWSGYKFFRGWPSPFISPPNSDVVRHNRHNLTLDIPLPFVSQRPPFWGLSYSSKSDLIGFKICQPPATGIQASISLGLPQGVRWFWNALRADKPRTPRGGELPLLTTCMQISAHADWAGALRCSLLTSLQAQVQGAFAGKQSLCSLRRKQSIKVNATCTMSLIVSCLGILEY